jgi:hypothetical protein
MTIADLLRQDERLTTERSGWDSWWQDLTDHFLPARTYRHPKGQPQGSQFDRIYDTVGMESAEGLANMLTTKLSPAGEKWVSYAPPPELQDDEEIMAYYRRASEVVLDYVLHSNYYTERHEANLDKAALGTSALFVSRGRKSLFQFKHVDLGTFNFQEDDEGTPQEIWRTIDLTPAQAAAMFPNTLGPKLTAALADSNNKHTQKFSFLHYVGPNPDYRLDKVEAKYKRFISRWICKTDKVDLDLSGFDAFPYELSRMLKWSASDQWGLAPGRKAMPALHQLNWLEHLNDLAAELQVRPRMLTIADQVGQVDLRAGGRTVVSERAAGTNLPREWLTNSHYDIGKDRAEEKREAVRRMFHQPLWQFLSQIDRQMTAYEVSAREREQLNLFAPQLSRHETDSQPLHARLFGIALQAGVLPPPPKRLLDATGPDIPNPIARTESRLAKVTRDAATQDYSAFIEILTQTARLAPDVLDSFDLAAAAREMARSQNLPSSIHRTESEVIEIAQQRAAAQQAQEGLAGAEQAAGAAAKASQADPNKVAEMAQMMGEMV